MSAPLFTASSGTLEHDPEKWEPVFGQDHAQRGHDPEKHVPDLIRDGNRFSEKIMRKESMIAEGGNGYGAAAR
jgi:hypothetical protein